MVSSIRKWCSNSLVAIERQILEYGLPIPTEQLSSAAESAVELAAFRKLTTFRNASPHDVEPALVNDEIVQLIDTSEFVASCPIDHTTSTDILGWLHESLVSRRRSNAGMHPSTSRKKGGVFYTPQPIVDYILRLTLRPRLNQATPDQVACLSLLDPSAGSGAFLVSAYRMLLEWHLQWLIANDPVRHQKDIVLTNQGWRLTRQKSRSILQQNIFGTDLDPTAILVTRRVLWLAMIDASEPEGTGVLASSITTESNTAETLSTNFRTGHALTGAPFRQSNEKSQSANGTTPLDWNDAFPRVSQHGGFDLIVGNPPYRRERQFKQELDEIAVTPLGRFRSARMDLWYYFVHRGIELLRNNGVLSFITTAYWLKGMGADKLIAALRDEVQVDELLLLHNQPVFPAVSGQHLIFRVTKSRRTKVTRNPDVVIKVASPAQQQSLQHQLSENGSLRTFNKPSHLLFRGDQLDVRPDATELLDKLNSHSRLGNLGQIRQGIAENPSFINRRTLERFSEAASIHRWQLGEGVFALTPDEVDQLNFTQAERALLRPYHALTDLGRYWLAAAPSRRLVFSTRHTCADISMHTTLRAHLERFHVILESRRETRIGANQWWHLHWPRDEQIWHASKLIIPQMVSRPSVAVARRPIYVSFSANVFVPSPDTREDLRYFCGVLNSRILWAWFQHHAKRRGVGLELNGHILRQAPIPRIDFQNHAAVAMHDNLIQQVDHRMQLAKTKHESPTKDTYELRREIAQAESQIDQLVASLFQLNPLELAIVDDLANESES